MGRIANKMMTFMVLIWFASTAFAGSPKSEPFLPDILHTWTEIMPGPTEFMGRGLNPTCSGAPGTDATFRFFVKGGSVNNLIAFFDGGGACWDTMNCIYYPTYYPAVDETVQGLTAAGGKYHLQEGERGKGKEYELFQN